MHTSRRLRATVTAAMAGLAAVAFAAGVPALLWAGRLPRRFHGRVVA